MLENATAGELIGGLISLIFVIYFFVAIARIEAATRTTASKLGELLGELRTLNERNARIDRTSAALDSKMEQR